MLSVSKEYRKRGIGSSKFPFLLPSSHHVLMRQIECTTLLVAGVRHFFLVSFLPVMVSAVCWCPFVVFLIASTLVRNSMEAMKADGVEEVCFVPSGFPSTRYPSLPRIIPL